MALSSSLRRALGDSSMYVKGMDGAKSSVQTQIENATTRLNAAGVSAEGQQSQNFLLKALDIISRPGYGATGLIREFTDPSSGGTPGEFDPLGAFWRGLKGEEKSTGKDVFMDVGLSGDEGIFGGEAKWYNPSPAGALGLALDLFNPLDPINWLGFGVGDDIVKGASKGLNALTDAFGATKAAQIADILTASAKVADTVGDVADATKIIDTIGDTAKAAKTVDTAADAARAAKAATSILDDLGAETVGKLAAQITSKVDDVDSLRRINELIQEGLKETGKVATSKLDYAVSKPLSIGLQNPLSVTPIGRLKTPGYTARGGKGAIPILAPGKNIAGTFVNIPGSENVTRIVGSIATKIKNTEVGQALGKMFSTVFVPNTVPASVVTRSMTAENMDDLVKLSRTSPANVPLSVEELLTLQDDLAGIKLGKTFDYADDFSATELKLLNKGEYFSVEDLAKKVGLKEFTTDDVLTTLAQTPFNKTIPELYDDLRLLKPTADAKELFTNAAKIRKMMDLMYEQIPEGAKSFFTGVLKSQVSDLYPSDITTSRLGKNVASSPLMAYEFNYKGVPVSVVVNSGENFNVNAWAKLSSTFEALDELPETAIQALKGQIDVSPIPIKSPDTSMTIGDTIVLGRIDKPTVAHEFGHVWDAAAGDQNAYTQAILSDAQKFDNTITPDDLYSDYSRSIYASDTTTGLKEDFADSVSDYLRDRSSFRSQYPGRAAEIERVLDQVSIPQEELAKMVAEQRKLAEQVSNIPRAEAQIKTMLDSVDKYAHKFTSEAGGKTYQTFRKNLAALYEQTNWKTKQWQEQVEALFQGIDKEARKQIMDAAAQITGTEIPGRAKSMAQPLFSQQDYPVFASKLQSVVDDMPNKMSTDQFKNYLKNKGVKAEELKWTFMDDFFEGKTSITKAEAQDWVRGNQLEVREVWRSTASQDIRSMRPRIQSLSDEFRAYPGDIEQLIQADVNELSPMIREMYPDWDDATRARFEGRIYDLQDGYGSDGLTQPARYSQYTQPGGQDYMELEFTLPQDYARPKTKAMPAMSALEVEYEDLASRIDDIAEEFGRYSQEYLTAEYRLQQIQMDPGFELGGSRPSYKSPHWGEDNVVAHTRFDTRYDDQGRKILYVDEIQSDWHQAGRDRGYIDGTTGEVLSGPGVGGEVPDAPFKSNWDEYVQKRLLRYAADNGYDGIAWSTGRQQAERWRQAITDAIDTLQYNQTGHSLRAYKNGEEVLSQTVEPQKLAEMVGADNARRLLSTEPDTFTVQPVGRNPSTDLSLERMPENMDPIEMIRWMDQQPEFQALRPVDGSQGAPQGFQVVDQNGNAWGYTYPSAEAAQKAIDDLATVGQRVKTVSGTNVTIGGEGMRKFYDQQMPSNFKKLGKQFGLQVDEIPLDFTGSTGRNFIEGLGQQYGNDGLLDFFERATDPEDFIPQAVGDIKAYFSPESGLYPGMEISRLDLNQSIDDYIKGAQELANHEFEWRDVNLSQYRNQIIENVSQDFPIPLTDSRTIGRQQGIWLNPESRTKITQQSFPLFADNTKAPVDELTAGWSEREIAALDNFLKWRNSVVKQYKQIGIPINELEKYVPFIPQRPLKKDEADLLKAAFGTGVRDATADNFDTLLTELSKADPNLKARTTKATRPSQVNEMLKKPWLTEDAAVAMNIRGQRAIKAQELNSFVDEFIQTYGLRADDLAQMAGNAVPDGYTAYKLGVDQAGNKTLQQATNVPRTAIEGTDIVFLPDEMAKLYNEYHGLMFNQSKKNGLLKVYDELSTLYKKAAYLWNPGHIMRDFQGNVFNNYLMGVVDPTEYADGLKALRKADGVLSTPRGDLKYTDIYEQAQKMGIVDSVMKHELPLNVGKQEKGYSRIMRQATYATDGWTRMTGFVHNLKAGQDYAQAAATTKKFLFDYFDLTAFEKKVMRRIIPFYTWMRKNIPLQFKTLISDPRIFARLNDVQNAIAGGPIDWDEKPDYIQDMMAIQPMGSDKYISNTLPWQDLTKIPTGLSSDSLSDFLSSVNPLIRAPIESITNTDWWTGQPLEDYAGEQTDIPVLTTLLRLLGSDTDYTVGARYGGNLLNQIPVLTRAGGLLDAATGQETSDSRILSRVSTTLGGPSVYDASSVQDSADWQERQRLVDLIRRLQDEGVEVPTINDLKRTSRYQRLKKILGGR
jgi:hypothetical protein